MGEASNTNSSAPQNAKLVQVCLIPRHIPSRGTPLGGVAVTSHLHADPCGLPAREAIAQQRHVRRQAHATANSPEGRSRQTKRVFIERFQLPKCLRRFQFMLAALSQLSHAKNKKAIDSCAMTSCLRQGSRAAYARTQ